MVDNNRNLIDNHGLQVDNGKGRMITNRRQTNTIREFILAKLPEHSHDIAKLVAQRFNITRQAVNKHIQHLLTQQLISKMGATKNCRYILKEASYVQLREERLPPPISWEKSYPITPQLAEDIVWSTDIQPLLQSLPANVLDIWHYGFTEMFNNAMDHSEGLSITVQVTIAKEAVEIMISDNGVGIFKKIQRVMSLLDERHALVELAKGKLTTDPKRHSGEGVFFTSKIFDLYLIYSGKVTFSHEFDKSYDAINEAGESYLGTSIVMKISNQSERKIKDTFDQYASEEDDYQFNKTIVPVKLAQYDNNTLISRSQAKRLLARVELFKNIVLDFTDIDIIGQAFADEIFRVFVQQRPEINLTAINYNADVKRMISRAQSVKL